MTPRGWTVRRRCPVESCDRPGCFLRLEASGRRTYRRDTVAVYPTPEAAREARARFTTGDGWRVCRVVRRTK